MLKVEIKIKDNISKKLNRMISKFPGYLTFLEIRAVEEVKESIRESLTTAKNQGGFKSIDRLLRGITSTKIGSGKYLIGIQAIGKTGTIHAERLVTVLDKGTFRPHTILPRNKKVLRWVDEKTGEIIWRKHVTRHYVRPRRFFAEAAKISRIKVRTLLKNSFHIFIKET